ncbi:MAG: C40 family peptidase [Actinobacteria bacterium]|nr:C40 family peptidase [Actinomycetota bacterium]
MGRQRRGLVILACLGMILGLPGVSSADPEQVREAEERLREAQQRTATAQDELGRIEEQVSIAVEAYNEANEQLAQIRAEMAVELEAFNVVQARMQDHQDAAGSLARRLFQAGPAYEIEALLGAGSPADVHARVVYLRSATRGELNAVAALKNDRRVHTAQLGRLEEVRAEAARQEQTLVVRKVEVEQLLAGQATEVSELRAQTAAAEQQHGAAVQAEQERLERERREREERERLAREAAAREAAAREAAARAEREAAAPPPSEPVRAPASAGEAARTAVDAALSQVGKPYRWGAEGPDAYDCSGLTKWAWAKAGVTLPHSSRMQYAVTQRVPRSDLQPGDLMFFGSPIHHVAMYIGGGKVVEAPYSGANVRINDRTVHRSDLTGIGRPRS